MKKMLSKVKDFIDKKSVSKTDERKTFIDKWEKTKLVSKEQEVTFGNIDEAKSFTEDQDLGEGIFVENEVSTREVKGIYKRAEEKETVNDSIMFGRMIELIKKLMKSDSLKIEFAFNDTKKAFVLSDSNSKFSLGIVYSPEGNYNNGELVLDYGGMRETAKGKQAKSYDGERIKNRGAGRRT